MFTVSLAAPAQEPEARWPSPDWPTARPADVGLDAAKLQEARDYSLTAGGSGMIVRHGRAVLRWGDQARRYDIKSATKSFGTTALGIAVKDGKIELDAPARRYHPTLGVPPESNAETGWLDKITILHLATQTAGFEKPGGYESLLFEPGTEWHYSDGGPNWLAECITLVYKRDLEDLMFERVFRPLGIGREDLRWRNNQYRPHEIEGLPRREFGAGIHANVEALSRLGYLYLRQGRWKDQQILSSEFVRIASRPVESVVGLKERDAKAHGNASDHYGLLWWNNADGALQNVPRDACWAWGLFDSLIVVMPSLDLVVVRGGEQGKRLARDDDADHYEVLGPFLDPIVAAAGSVVSRLNGRNQESPPTQAVSTTSRAEAAAPVPPSRLIREVVWAPRDSIIRQAKGSDTWPMTWGDDGHLYTAYADGWGFDPRVPEKLSLGVARVAGRPPEIKGENIRAESVEQHGDGERGKKASGLLIVDGVLYMLARNASNSQLAWSKDHGRTWTWADWKFTTSFGYPTFLNFGKNYAGARDEYVYVYSSDSDSAYRAGDRMVLARVPRDRIVERAAYEFFVRVDAEGTPQWTPDIDRRGAVFSHPGRCYRLGVTYNAALKRYLWCQIYPESSDSRGPRFQGGFGIYDAPEPWGPWTTVYHTNEWDVGPGETSSFPTKWMSDDGRTLHLVFSGDDYFSVRQATLKIAD
ncbi:MAG TPA: serine hydrolase, partial [Planctomycetaceae bacterium]|nr:serine hydrolase [Planctomycetaceae bacterium]